MASYRPPTTSESGIAAVLQEAWSGGGGAVWNSSIAEVLNKETGVSAAEHQAHLDWADKNSAFLSKNRILRDTIEPYPHGGWLFRPPGPVPVSTNRDRVTEYGPEDFAKLEGVGGLSYQHRKLQLNEYHPSYVNPLGRYGI